VNGIVSPSDVLPVSKFHKNCADSSCYINSRSDTGVPDVPVDVSTDYLQPPVSSIVPQYDSVTVAGIISNSLIISPCECKLKDCSSDAGCEASNKTSSNTEVMSCDTVIACSASYCML